MPRKSNFKLIKRIYEKFMFLLRSEIFWVFTEPLLNLNFLPNLKSTIDREISLSVIKIKLDRKLHKRVVIPEKARKKSNLCTR